MPHFSSVPGRKFSTTTSALAIKVRAMSRPSSVRRSIVTDFLLRPITGHQGDSPLGLERPHWRIGSPTLGSSSLITSAPKSPNTCPQKGPAISEPISITRNPESGPSIIDMFPSSTGTDHGPVMFFWHDGEPRRRSLIPLYKKEPRERQSHDPSPDDCRRRRGGAEPRCLRPEDRRDQGRSHPGRASRDAGRQPRRHHPDPFGRNQGRRLRRQGRRQRYVRDRGRQDRG